MARDQRPGGLFWVGCITLAVAFSTTATAQQEGQWSVGATTPVGSTNTPLDDRYNGAAVRYWMESDRALVGGARFTTAGDDNVGFFGEFQLHEQFLDGFDTTFYFGGGFDFQEKDDDNIVSAYLPVGFATPLRNYPVSWTLSTAVRAYLDPETEIEAFDDIRLGVYFDF